MNILNELGDLAESNFAEIKAKKKRLNELMDLYGENKIDIENKATNTEYMEYILAEPYVDEVLYERKAKKQNISEMRGKREKEIMNLVDEEIDNWNEDNWKDYISKQPNIDQKVYSILGGLPEYKILAKNKAKMERVGSMLVNEFGSGAADGIDNLYHRRGMFEIGQMVNKGYVLSPLIGMSLGVLKEVNDIRKKYKKEPLNNILLDSFKDMVNNSDGMGAGIYNYNSFNEEYKDFDYKKNRKK